MSVFSKPTIPFDCYEIGHTWDPSCRAAAAGVGLSCFEESLKIYSSVYILSSLLSGKPPDINGLKKIFFSILQSSLFLGSNGFFYMRSFCLCRAIFGDFRFFTLGALSSFFANFASILIERPSRRAALAIYVTNVASETLFNMMVARGWFRPIPNGSVLLFSLTLAALLRWFRTTKNTMHFQYKLLRALVGDQELKPTVPDSSTINQRKGILEAKHALCPHAKGCLKYSILGIAQRFVYGWGLHTCVSLVLSLPVLLRKPSKFPSLLTQPKHIRFGAFLAALVGTYRAVHCSLRWICGSNSNNHSLLAGLLAGASITFYKNTTVLLYLVWKTLEMFYLEGIDAGLLPEIPGFPILLYSLSTSVLFHAAIMEPHNLKPTYWKFLMRITGNKMGELNRKVIDIMGTQSSKKFPNFRPIYDPEYLSKDFKSYLEQSISSVEKTI